MNANEQLIDKVFRDYETVGIKFVGANYWQTLRLTYVRTIADVTEGIAKAGFGVGQGSSPSVLEIGAYTGVVSTALRRLGFAVTACEIPLFMKDEALRAHYRREGIQALVGELSSLPLDVPDASFDVLVCCEVIEHLNFNILPVFREFRRLLKPGGMLYLATPNLANIVTRLRLLGGKSIHNPIQDLQMQLNPESDFSIGLHWREFTARELKELFVLNGFRMIEHRYVHYSYRRQSRFPRKQLVDLMYRLFPSFLPGQIVMGIKAD